MGFSQPTGRGQRNSFWIAALSEGDRARFFGEGETLNPEPYVSCSLSSLEVLCRGLCRRLLITIGLAKGDTRSLDYSSCSIVFGMAL